MSCLIAPSENFVKKIKEEVESGNSPMLIFLLDSEDLRKFKTTFSACFPPTADFWVYLMDADDDCRIVKSGIVLTASEKPDTPFDDLPRYSHKVRAMIDILYVYNHLLETGEIKSPKLFVYNGQQEAVFSVKAEIMSFLFEVWKLGDVRDHRELLK